MLTRYRSVLRRPCDTRKDDQSIFPVARVTSLFANQSPALTISRLDTHLPARTERRLLSRRHPAQCPAERQRERKPQDPQTRTMSGKSAYLFVAVCDRQGRFACIRKVPTLALYRRRACSLGHAESGYRFFDVVGSAKDVFEFRLVDDGLKMANHVREFGASWSVKGERDGVEAKTMSAKVIRSPTRKVRVNRWLLSVASEEDVHSPKRCAAVDDQGWVE